MVRQLLAGLVDAALIAVLCYVGFRVALWAAPCDGHMDNCFIMVPLILLFVLIALTVYYVVGYQLFGRTIGRQLLGVP